MKTLSGTAKLITLAVTVSGLMCALIACERSAQSPPTSKKNADKYSIRLKMGLEGDQEPLHCTRKSLHAALDDRPRASYKIHYHNEKDQQHDEDLGEMPNLSASMITPARDIGGADPSPTPSGGVHSTQRINFADLSDLQTFAGTLKYEEP